MEGKVGIDFKIDKKIVKLRTPCKDIYSYRELFLRKNMLNNCLL